MIGLPPQSPAVPPIQAPQMPPPSASGADRFFAGAAQVMTHSWGDKLFVWLPAISTDPNAGPTYGLMPVLVISHPETHHIRQLIAPSYTYNSLFGQTGTARYYFYPTEASQLYAVGSISQHTNREIKLRYENTAAHDGVLYVRGEVYYSADASARFYGLGETTHEDDVSGYTAKDSTIDGSIGYNFEKYWRATFGGLFRRFATGSDIIPDTVDLHDRFADVTGVGTMNTGTAEFRLLWDTRDSPVTPSMGSSGEVYTQKTTALFGTDADYFRYGLEGRRLFPWKNHPNQTTVIHAQYDQANGPSIPFYDLPSLGGRTTLRGFGDGRFTDHGRMVFNFEQRIVFARLALMGIQTNFEVAPFFDLGSTFPSIGKLQRRYLTPVYGGAFRAAVKPNVVGDVEVGVGREGPAVFVDINYPF